MSEELVTGSSALSSLRDCVPLPLRKGLDCFQIDSNYKDLPHENRDLRYLDDLVSRILHRGAGTLPSIEVERLIASIFGAGFGLTERTEEPRGLIEWHVEPELSGSVEQFSDFLSAWVGNPDHVSLDPTHPQNERRLLRQMLDHFGPKFMSCLYTQVHLSKLLPGRAGEEFIDQRLDFLVAFPNGSCFVLEPGDHDDAEQNALDQNRTNALKEIGIPTLRFPNDMINTQELIDRIEEQVRSVDGHRFLETDNTIQGEENLRLSYLLLLPTLIARLEHILSTALLRRGLLGENALSLCVVEQDLECTEIALYSFMERLERLAELYDIELPSPDIHLVIVRSGSHSCADWSGVREQLAEYRCTVEEAETVPVRTFDLSIDVAIKANDLTVETPVVSRGRVVVRNVYQHSSKWRFSYSETHPRALELEDDDQALLRTFLTDFFRKKEFRDGQFPIVQNIMAQKETIGLLPTSAGKSICYQLASLLTPGITLVIDPIIFLMDDQVIGLTEYGITAVEAWHSGGDALTEEGVGELMATNLMIFVAPERFLIDRFRTTMRRLTPSGLFVNYAVIDEGHCVSMWGHNFRTSYLMLRRCLREYCTFFQREPVIVALTGTASQLVLIDLKRQLDIEEMGSIVRPTTFDRPELVYNIVSCSSHDKMRTLFDVLETIKNKLGVTDIQSEAHGMVFAHRPDQVWDLYNALAAADVAVGGDADSHVVEIASEEWRPRELKFGMACGNAPKDSPVTPKQWQRYKKKILEQFKRGQVRMLIGNDAIGVGVDCEHLNYIVVYSTPSSLESLGQKWGRAGRRGQNSLCYLIFSDDNPVLTDQWLSGDLERMPRRDDDLGTIDWFHSTNFPGEEIEAQGALNLIRIIVNAERNEDGRITINGTERTERYLNYLDGLDRRQHTIAQEKRTERYLSFLIMLGIVKDYESTHGRRYRVTLSREFKDAVAEEDTNRIREILVGELANYLNRYRPTTEQEISEGIERREQGKFSNRCVRYLIHFIYSEIGYQRKRSIQTIVGFCREEDQSPEEIRKRMKAFFDRSEKFSDRLDAMADQRESIEEVIEVIELIEGYDEVEHLFWETSRLLDERPRADWAAINLYALINREKAVSKTAHNTYQVLLQRLPSENRVGFLVGLFSRINFRDRALTTPQFLAVLGSLFEQLWKHEQSLCLQVLEDIGCDEDTKLQIRGLIAIKQTEGLLNECKHQHGLG